MLNLPFPAVPFDLLIAVVMAVATAFVFGFFRRSGFPMLLVSILASCAGFALGQLIANALGWDFVMIGRIHVIEGLLGSILALFIVNS
jgi:hypothetical protein